jgi:hypothetical protein
MVEIGNEYRILVEKPLEELSFVKLRWDWEDKLWK